MKTRLVVAVMFVALVICFGLVMWLLIINMETGLPSAREVEQRFATLYAVGTAIYSTYAANTATAHTR
jgi:hypothetical protein